MTQEKKGLADRGKASPKRDDDDTDVTKAIWADEDGQEGGLVARTPPSAPAQADRQTPSPAMRATNVRRCRKNTLRGFFDLVLPSGLILRGCALHLSHGRHWVETPASRTPTRAEPRRGPLLSISAINRPAPAFNTRRYAPRSPPRATRPQHERRPDHPRVSRISPGLGWVERGNSCGQRRQARAHESALRSQNREEG